MTQPASATERVLPRGLPAPPSDELEPYLDAATCCVERYGWSRTSTKDIAREAGVERTTLYRHLGSKDRILRLLIAREAHRLIDAAIATAATVEPGPEVVVEIVAHSLEYVWGHKALSKLLADDAELLQGFVTDGLSDTGARFVDALAPVLGAAMDAGTLASRDPAVVIEWLVRVTMTLIVAPAPGDPRRFLRTVITPVLEPRAQR